MADLCFATVCSSNHFQYFIPVFIYSAKKAYPDAGVKVFVVGKLKEEIRSILDKLRNERLIDGNWDVLENRYESYPSLVSTCNCLRFLLSKENFNGYKYVLIKDVDFIILPQEPSHIKYLSKRLKDVGEIILGTRGPYNFPSRPYINGHGWKGEFTRIAGGTVLLKNPEWFDKTERAVKEYRQWMKYGQHDDIDNHIVASYREYDEVMLYRICRKCHIKVPAKKSKAADNKGISKIYRDIHLGDFSKKRNTFRKIRKKISNECIKEYKKLEKDAIWQEVKAVASMNPKVKKPLAMVKKCLK